VGQILKIGKTRHLWRLELGRIIPPTMDIGDRRREKRCDKWAYFAGVLSPKNEAKGVGGGFPAKEGAYVLWVGGR